MKPGHRWIVALTIAALPAGAVGKPLFSLSEDCEIAVAKSAAPYRLRPAASVYVLRGEEYVRAIDGNGPLTCIIERNHRDSLLPQCFDRNGIDSVLPAIIFRSLMAVSGATPKEIEKENADKMSHGAFNALPGPGISYMMSAYNYAYVPSAERVLTVPPHVMFYAPGLQNEDVGGSFESMVTNTGTPFVFNSGPHGYMLVYTEHPADPDEVAEVCRGELGEAPPRFAPIPVDRDGTQ